MPACVGVKVRGTLKLLQVVNVVGNVMGFVRVKLAPPPGTFERLRLQEWLHFIGTEVHKQFAPLFNPQLSEDDKSAQRKKIGNRFDYVEKELGKKAFLTGDTFTVADAYLFNMLRWTAFTGIDLAKWPVLSAYSGRVESRPSVKAALEAEKASS